MLTKSDFLKYIQCPKCLWLGKYRKDLVPEITEAKQRVFDDGFEVEEYTYKLFPGGVSAKTDDFKRDKAETLRLMHSDNKAIFQATFSNFDTELFCRSDILKYDDENQVWDIYESKSSTQAKKIHFYDLAFQRLVLESEGYKIGKTLLILVNNQYIKNGEIIPTEFLKIEDVSEQVNEVLEETRIKMEEALKILKLKDYPEVRMLKQCNDPYECDFLEFCSANIPEDSIYDVAYGLSEEQMNTLLDMGIIKIEDIPDGFIEKEKYLRHLEAMKKKEDTVDIEKIKEELGKLEYPLYFIDYETYSPAVPAFDGYRPYERITFQYSLHIQRAPGGELEHYEFLSKDFKDPAPKLIESLKNIVGEKGSFISWNMVFEKGCNSEMALRNPESKDFFENINERMFDLMDIFKNGYVVKRAFKASASIKKVLPVMVPELSYKDLNIHEGGTASVSWLKLTNETLDEEKRLALYRDMLDYCKLDTLAMVEILREVNKLIN